MSTKSRLDRVGSVRVVTLDDDAKRNAIGYELADELLGHVAAVAADSEARAMVITGAGKAFSSGADLPQVFGEERSTPEMYEALRSYYRCFLSIRELSIPTVAAVNGPAVGAGLNLALACDMRLASPRAIFGATFARIGLHPGGGCTAFLVRSLGRQRAIQVLLTGATLNAHEALECGLVMRICDDPLAEALKLGEQLGDLEPWLTRAILRSVEVAATSSFEIALEVEAWAQAESTHSARFREWIAQFA